jgi:prepilin signal peptidase PulO-like enzyme (type II secretory pathway)
MISLLSCLEPTRPLSPTTIAKTENFATEFIIGILALLAIVGATLLVGWVLNKMMANKGFNTNLTVNLILSAVIPIALFLRYGASLELVQGVFLMFVLMYATWSDLTSHTVDDYVPLLVFALGVASMATVGLSSMLFGAFAVFVPQIVMALIPKCKPLGGADLKLSTALAFLLGWERGIIGFVAGLLIAVIYMAIYNRVKKTETKEEKAFALVPFLSIAAMVLFMF